MLQSFLVWTGLNVQHWLADEATPNDPHTYEPVVCQACTRLHFVNRVSGKLLGEKNEGSVGDPFAKGSE
jgi:hypothetical protein